MPPRLRSAIKAVQTASSIATSLPAVTPALAPSSAASATPPVRLFEDAVAWETWLETNHGDQKGLWLKLSKKGGSIPSVSYDEALDVALCFGWIDGQKRSHDAHHFIQRFTPRRPRSMWSKRNVDKVAVLTAAGRMRQPGQAEVDAAKADGRWEKAYSSASTMQVPPDFQAALDQNKKAKTFFDGLGRTKRYPFLWRLETTKREETRRKKIEQFVALLGEGKTL